MRTETHAMQAAPVTIVGSVTREPEIRYTREGKATTVLGVAVVTVERDPFDPSPDTDADHTSFFDVVTFGVLAENIAVALVKGMHIVVVGRLRYRAWETEDSEMRSKVEVHADDVGISLRGEIVDR